jgi:hypothetical protein
MIHLYRTRTDHELIQSVLTPETSNPPLGPRSVRSIYSSPKNDTCSRLLPLSVSSTSPLQPRLRYSLSSPSRLSRLDLPPTSAHSAGLLCTSYLKLGYSLSPVITLTCSVRLFKSHLPCPIDQLTHSVRMIFFLIVIRPSSMLFTNPCNPPHHSR